MKQSTKEVIKKVGKPLYIIYKRCELHYSVRHPMKLADRIFYRQFGRHIDWNSPKDLNEKIQWLKFHVDQREWAKLADKYEVREYVRGRGLHHILIPVFGKWNSVQEVLDNWDNLPEEFVLKCNTGAGLILIVSKENGGKEAIDTEVLRKKLKKWFATTQYNITNAELHYQFITNCVFAEKLLRDDSTNGLSNSMIDYKIWCFDGKPYGCFVAYDRDIKTKQYKYNFYDLDWNPHPELMKGDIASSVLPKPDNWGEMLEIASRLSKGHPQVRVDLYNLNGKIYFGEMTMTSQGGFMRHYSPELLLDMGGKVNLDMSMDYNEFAR